MSCPIRARSLHKRPVVTLAGDSVGQIRDMIFGTGGGDIVGFAIGSKGFLPGRARQALPWPSVVGLGPDAAMIQGNDSLLPLESFLGTIGVVGTAFASDVSGSEVFTTDGGSLGKVTDVIVSFPDLPAGQVDVVGYEIAPAESLGVGRDPVLIPLPDTLSVSRDNLVVPAEVREHICQDDLASFAQIVATFRQRHQES